MNKLLLILLIYTSFSACLNKEYSEYQIIDGKSIGKLKIGEKININNINSLIDFKINSDSIIKELYTSSPRYITLKGVRVGDNIQLIESKYGKPIKQELELKKGKYTIGKIENIMLYKKLIFYHENDTIKSIGIKDNHFF